MAISLPTNQLEIDNNNAKLQYQVGVNLASTWTNGAAKINTMYKPVNGSPTDVFYNPTLKAYFYITPNNTIQPLQGSVVSTLSKNAYTTVVGKASDLSSQKVAGTVNSSPSARVTETASAPKTNSASSTSSNNKTTSTTSSTSTTPVVNTSTGGSGVSSPGSYYDGYAAGVAANNDKINELTAQIEQVLNPKIWSADELAEYYNLQDLYNRENILKDYNAKTNDYYDALIKEQNLNRNKVSANDALYLNQVINDYLNTYKYADNTASRRSTTAANTLSTMLNSQTLMNQNDLGLQQLINNSEEQRKAELANNPYLAEQYYNKIGSQLIDWGTNKYESDVRNYVNALDAYAQAYNGERTYQAALASANARKYSGLANAAATKANSVYNDNIQALIDTYNRLGYNGNTAVYNLSNLGYGITNK